MITKISERKDHFCKDKSWNVEVCIFSEHFNVMVEISVDAQEYGMHEKNHEFWKILEHRYKYKYETKLIFFESNIIYL